MIERSAERSGSQGVNHNVNSVYWISIFLSEILVESDGGCGRPRFILTFSRVGAQPRPVLNLWGLRVRFRNPRGRRVEQTAAG